MPWASSPRPLSLLQGSEEQKQRYLPDMNTCQKVACWALTEPDQGSDASALKTTATPVEHTPA